MRNADKKKSGQIAQLVGWWISSQYWNALWRLWLSQCQHKLQAIGGELRRKLSNGSLHQCRLDKIKTTNLYFLSSHSDNCESCKKNYNLLFFPMYATVQRKQPITKTIKTSLLNGTTHKNALDSAACTKFLLSVRIEIEEINFASHFKMRIAPQTTPAHRIFEIMSVTCSSIDRCQ